MKLTRGRPKTFNEEEILLLAMQQFWKNGYDNTSLDDLLQAMNIKKSSFYATFKNKEEIFSKALNLYRKNSILYLNTLKEQLGPKEALLFVANEHVEQLKKDGEIKGCLIMNSSKECYKKYTYLSHQLKCEYDFFLDIFREFISLAKESHSINNPLSAKILSGRYSNTLNGLISTINVGADMEHIEDILISLNELLS